MNQSIQGSDSPGTRGVAQVDTRQLLVQAVNRHWLSIIGMSLLISFFVGLYSITQQRIYEASATVVPPLSLQKDRLGGRAGLGGGAALMEQLMGGAGISALYVEVIHSRAVEDVIIDRLDLQRAYKAPRRSDARQILERATTARLADNGSVKVAVRDVDPNRAAAITNAYVEELGRITQGFRIAEAKAKKEFLQNRVFEIQKELSAVQEMPAYEAKMKEILFEMLSREYEMARIEEAWSMPTVQVLDAAVPPEIPVPRGTLTKCALAGMFSMVLVTYFWIAREGRLLNKRRH